MSADLGFVDSNVLVYAHDVSAGSKRERARELLAGLWETRRGCLSVQVLQEFFVTVTRKVPSPLGTDDAADAIASYARWRVHAPGPPDVLAAIGLARRDKVSFWDAMILRSAAALDCGVLYSEDLNDGHRYDGVQIRNPFAGN
jgi:predicted nucleic acid-binding protein